MLRTIAAVLTYLGLATAALAQQPAYSPPSTTAQIAIAGTVAASTRIVTGVSGKRIYVTALALIPVPTSVVTFTYGTGTNCATNPVAITGDMTFSAGQTLSLGVGAGAVFALPAGVDLCVTIATAAAPGSLAYAQY